MSEARCPDPTFLCWYAMLAAYNAWGALSEDEQEFALSHIARAIDALQRAEAQLRGDRA